jgi:prevent-host-death family protein
MKKIPALQVRRQLGALLDEVRLRGAEFVIERDGRPVAAVIPVEMYERLRERRESTFDRIEAIRDRLGLSDADVATALAEDDKG